MSNNSNFKFASCVPEFGVGDWLDPKERHEHPFLLLGTRNAENGPFLICLEAFSLNLWVPFPWNPEFYGDYAGRNLYHPLKKASPAMYEQYKLIRLALLEEVKSRRNQDIYALAYSITDLDLLARSLTESK